MWWGGDPTKVIVFPKFENNSSTGANNLINTCTSMSSRRTLYKSKLLCCDLVHNVFLDTSTAKPHCGCCIDIISKDNMSPQTLNPQMYLPIQQMIRKCIYRSAKCIYRSANVYTDPANVSTDPQTMNPQMIRPFHTMRPDAENRLFLRFEVFMALQCSHCLPNNVRSHGWQPATTV